jgi:Cu(I)/Ag(I) efflux system membrane fusion protein/cobalt-zinc-cadmium efflux system membrane fusion protein
MMTNKTKIFWLSLAGLALILGLAGGYFLGKKSEPSAEKSEMVSDQKQLYSCGMHPEIIQEGPGNCPICGMKLTPVRGTAASDVKPTGERKVKYWKSSMDPTYISDQPGKDAMGMDLVPVYEDEVQVDAIAIDPITIQNMGLRTALVTEQNMTRTIRTVGHIDYNEEKLYTVNAKISGWIEKLYVDKTGEAVKRGEPLLEIYSPELVSTQQEYLTALRNYQLLKDSSIPEARQGAKDLLEMTEKRLLNWDIGQAQIEQLEKTGEIRKSLVLYAPADGIVTQKEITAGAFVEAGMTLFKIADLSIVWVLAHIFEYELPFVKLGQTAHIESPYLPGEKRQGRVTYIYPYLNEVARDIKLRIEVPNPGLKLKPEMYANIAIASELSGKRVAIPEEAVIRSGKREIIFLDLGEGKFLPREVQTGVSGEADMVEIKQGLKPGEKVVVSAQFMLDSESKTQEAIKKMLQIKQASMVTEKPVKQEKTK